MNHYNKVTCSRTVVCTLSMVLTPLMIVVLYLTATQHSISLSPTIRGTGKHQMDGPFPTKPHASSSATQHSVSLSPTIRGTGKHRMDGPFPTKPHASSSQSLPDCMQRRQSYPTSGTSVKEWNLCKACQGTTRTDCVYNHPSVFNFILFSSSPEQSVLRLREYLAIYSVHKFYKPDKVVIHCNHEIQSNNYWKMLQNLSTPLETKHTERIQTIGKSGTRAGYITHEADYFKISHCLKNGGMYADFDVVVLNGTKLREMQRRSEVILGRDNNECTTTCAGFISCVPGSPLVRKWLNSYDNDYKPRLWIHNAGNVPSQLLRSCPECYDAIVDGSISNYDEARFWGRAGKLVKWRERSVVHYMNAAFMKPLRPVKEISKMNTSFAEMVNYILEP